MKKLLCIISLLLLVGCANVTKIKPITRGISFVGEMKYYNEYYELSVDIDKNGEMKIKIDEPTELGDLVFTFKDDEMSVSFKGISHEFGDTYKTEALNLIYKAFKEESPDVYEKNDEFFITGEYAGNEYKMFIGESGLPLKITNKGEKFEILIKNPTIK